MPSEATIRAEARWRAVVSGWSKSGQDITRYCAERGVSRWGFYRWRSRLERVERERRPEFVPVRVVEARRASGPAGVEVREATLKPCARLGSNDVFVRRGANSVTPTPDEHRRLITPLKQE